jgi:hypothetical protein
MAEVKQDILRDLRYLSELAGKNSLRADMGPVGRLSLRVKLTTCINPCIVDAIFTSLIASILNLCKALSCAYNLLYRT